MNYVITKERQAYLDAHGWIALFACPGSGKTTSIVVKLHKLICELYDKGQPGGVACLSFTNAACEEFCSKYYAMYGENIPYPHSISTIDSFITQYLVIPFGGLVGCNTHIQIENDETAIARIFRHSYQKGNVWKEVIIPSFRKYSRLLYAKNPKDCYIDLDGEKWKSNSPSTDYEKNYIRDCVEHKMKAGIISSKDALWIAYEILTRYPIIAKALAHRFPYIIVDEAQDTTALQMQILQLLRANGVANMEFIGDVYQSLYSWNGARPEKLKSLTDKCRDFKVFYFSECRRSVQRIIDVYSRLRPLGEPPIVSKDVIDEHREVIVYRYADGAERSVMHDFVEKCSEYDMTSRCILARGSAEVEDLNGESNELKLWKSRVPEMLIEAKRDFDSGKFEHSARLLSKVWCECLYSPSQIEDRKRFMEELNQDVEKKVCLVKLMKKLPNLNMSFLDWQMATETLLQEKLNLNHVPDFDRKQKLAGKHMNDILNDKVSSYYCGEIKDEIDKVKTIHSVKGASYDAVLLFMSSKLHAQTISIYDFPDDGRFLNTNDVKEKHNLIYVACSRAKQFLAFAVPIEVSNDDIIRKLGSNVTILTFETH